MNASYQWDVINSLEHETAGSCCSCFKKQKKKSEVEYFEIAGALIQNSSEFIYSLEHFITSDTILFQDAELKRNGEPASNLRFKKNNGKNNTVVENYLKMYEFYSQINDNPIVITTYPRQNRQYSFKMVEDGTCDCTNTYTKESEPDKEDIFEAFLDGFKISTEKMIIIRECSNGAHYYTYMADCISFILQIFYISNPEYFSEEYRKPVTSNVEGRDFLYFELSDKSDTNSIRFMIPNTENIEEIYSFFWNLVTTEENTYKEKVRNHFTDCKYIRWSDYSANDVDDIFTILMIINCFNSKMVDYELTKIEVNILNQFKAIVKPWFSQLDIAYI